MPSILSSKTRGSASWAQYERQLNSIRRHNSKALLSQSAVQVCLSKNGRRAISWSRSKLMMFEVEKDTDAQGQIVYSMNQVGELKWKSTQHNKNVKFSDWSDEVTKKKKSFVTSLIFFFFE